MRYRLLTAKTPAALVALLVGAACLLTCGKSEMEKTPNDTDHPAPTGIMGWSVADSVGSYDRETIFKYINGAGEVYRAYDFRQVKTWKLVKKDAADILVEVFDMGSAEDAYGVFSHSREDESSGIGQGYEFRGGLVSFWQGRFFVCVLAEEANETTQEAVFALARDIAGRIPVSDGPPALLGCLPVVDLHPQSVRFFHLSSSLNSHYFLAEQNILQMNRDTRAVLAEYGTDRAYLLCVEYQSADLAEGAFASFVSGYIPESNGRETVEIAPGKWVAARHQARHVIVVLDASTEARASKLLEGCTRSLTDIIPQTGDN